MEGNHFMDKFIEENPISQDVRDYFQTIPWLAKHANDARYTGIPTYSRVLKPSGEDYFFARTINTPTTIPHQLTLVSRELNTPTVTASAAEAGAEKQNHKAVTKVPETPDTVMLLHLGTPGLDGHPSTLHGGMLCAILDETMGLCVMLHNTQDTGPRDSLFTVSLTTTYRAAVPTPSDVLVRCWLTNKDGRKWYARGQVVNEEGVVMTEAEGLWLSVKKQANKL